MAGAGCAVDHVDGRLLGLSLHELPAYLREVLRCLVQYLACGRDGITKKAIADAHDKDVETQAKYGVRYLKYWFDEATGKVLCLIEAPNKEAAIAVAKNYGYESHLLSWFDKRGGTHSLMDECCVDGEPSWIASAEARNGNLTIDVNDEDYVFIFHQSGQFH